MAAIEEPIQLHYKDLIDIALGSTDIGLFNLHLLHTILQCLVVNLNLDITTIEYNGSQRSNIEHFFTNRAAVAKQTIIEKVETEPSGEVQIPQINLVVKDHDREENPCGYPGPPGKMVSRSIPKCKDILAALKCNKDPAINPIGEMVDLINLTERMTAAEIAIEKLSSIIHDLMLKNQALTDLIDEKNEQIASLVDRLSNVEVETNINVGEVKTSGTSEAGGTRTGDSVIGGKRSESVSNKSGKNADVLSRGGVGAGSVGAGGISEGTGGGHAGAGGGNVGKGGGHAEPGAGNVGAGGGHAGTGAGSAGKGGGSVGKGGGSVGKGGGSKGTGGGTGGAGSGTGGAGGGTGGAGGITGEAGGGTGGAVGGTGGAGGATGGAGGATGGAGFGTGGAANESGVVGSGAAGAGSGGAGSGPEEAGTGGAGSNSGGVIAGSGGAGVVSGGAGTGEVVPGGRDPKSGKDDANFDKASPKYDQAPGNGKGDIDNTGGGGTGNGRPNVDKIGNIQNWESSDSDLQSGIDGGHHSVKTQLITHKPGEEMLKDDSVVALFIRSQSQDLEKLLEQKKGDIFKDFQDMFICSGGLVTGKMLNHLERDLLRKLHLFKSMVFERLIAVECNLSGTQKQVKHINDNVEDLLDLFARLSKKVDHLDEFEKSSIERFVTIQKNIQCLMAEREVRRRQIYDLIESIEMVKSIKANKEDLDTLATQKADKVLVDSKVSIKKFNVIQNDLACSIIQTMERNSSQDIEMSNAVKRIETIMEGKIDKNEYNYAVVSLTKRIDEVSDKLNEMIKLRVCPEGAGTVQMLKNVRCITCNDVVQMKMEECNTLPRTAILKTKHQFAMQVETECRTGTKPKITEIIRSRYCGGEYTMMEPNEKVPQKTDFYIDANVCPPPMSDVYYIEGNDGALYRAQAPECVFKNTNSSHIIKRKPSK